MRRSPPGRPCMDMVDTLLLRRDRRVFLGSPHAMRAEPGARLVDLDRLEDRLPKLGFRLDEDLLQRLAGMSADRLVEFGQKLHETLVAETGADRAHTPLLEEFTQPRRRRAGRLDAE